MDRYAIRDITGPSGNHLGYAVVDLEQSPAAEVHRYLSNHAGGHDQALWLAEQHAKDLNEWIE